MFGQGSGDPRLVLAVKGVPMWGASRLSVHTRRLCVWGVPHEGTSLWRVWGVFGCPCEGASLWRVWGVSMRGGLVRPGFGDRCKFEHCFVCTCREEMVDEFPPEVTLLGARILEVGREVRGVVLLC